MSNLYLEFLDESDTHYLIEAQDLDTSLFGVIKQDKATKEQTIIIDMLYNEICFPNCGRIPFKIGDKWGFFDYDGNEVISPIFDRAIGFVDYSIIENGAWAYYSETPEPYCYAEVTINGQRRLVDVNGRILNMSPAKCQSRQIQRIRASAFNNFIKSYEGLKGVSFEKFNFDKPLTVEGVSELQ